MTTEAQARAIAEALGWAGNVYQDGDLWTHELYYPKLYMPRLTDDTTIGRAMCYDAIVWLRARAWKTHSITFRPNARDIPAGPAALEAAMIQELGP